MSFLVIRFIKSRLPTVPRSNGWAWSFDPKTKENTQIYRFMEQ